MSKVSPRCLSALLLSASALAIAATSSGARADTTITSASGPISVGSGNLTNNGTISETGSFASKVAVLVQANSSIGTLANNGLITVGVSNGVAVGVIMGGPHQPSPMREPSWPRAAWAMPWAWILTVR
ncbi:hypothetical protein [Nitrospirillum sp. BR 11163]|uniref:hypothetical protein n=1 Tax=Nitrospirillum sp. BR 11163 TaxID=3104323 RepID=UPI002AFFFD11|nr:hypothetical protein [Nitrospirillum sp. BR 11163]MEA1673205.1 hypothetical protein [Nitrospirillum sp. BR 11163]